MSLLRKRGAVPVRYSRFGQFVLHRSTQVEEAELKLRKLAAVGRTGGIFHEYGEQEDA